MHARRPHNGATALYVAAFYGNVEMITALTGAGGDVDTASNNGFAAVHAATSMGHAEVVRLLAELGARVEAPVNSGTATPVYLAALNGHVKVVRVLAELGASVKTQGKDGSTPLFAAAQEGHVGVVRVLAELGACVRKAANDGFTPVHVAAQMGHAEVIRLLASLKADIAARWVPEPNKLGWSPFALSADGAHFEATKALLLLGAPITIEDLKQYSDNEGDTRQLRADLQAWAADALVQHRIFTSTFLFGCSAHGDIALTILEGEEELRAQVAEFVGIVVGKELRRTRAMGPAIAAIDWAPHDDPWPVESESEDEDEEEE